MKQRLTTPRSTDISVLHSLHYVFIFLILTFIAVITQCKTIHSNDLDLNLEHHKAVVDELKTKVLQIMGRSAPPSGYNASRHGLHGKLIREFFRTKLNTTTHTDRLRDEDIYLNDPQVHIFHSSDTELMVPVQLVKTPTSASALNMIKFSTNFQQPDVPYHDLLIKSAILRLRINRQKRKLRRKSKSPLNVTVYLMDNTDQVGVLGDNVRPTPLRSLTVNMLKSKTINIDIQSQLLSHLVESDNKVVTLGIRVDQIVPAVKTGGKVKKDKKRSPIQTTTPPASHQKKEHVRLSKVILQVTSQTQDLRKARSKRQDDESATCPGNMCCRHSIYVDFADIGWNDWVLFPTGYTAYYCKGGCPDRYKIASSFTNIKSILHERSPDTVPAPICAPTGYNPLTMIIWNEEMTDLAYPGMVVTGCRCH